MVSVNLRLLRKKNGLSQQQLAEFLGIGQGFVSQMEKGDRPIPDYLAEKIINNDKGWALDFTEEESRKSKGASRTQPETPLEAENIVLRKENELLYKQVEELKAEKASYWELIERLSGK